LPGTLQVGHGSHGAIGELGRLVLSSLSFQDEHGYALLLPVGTRGEGRIAIPDDELVVIAQRRVREVVEFGDLKDGPIRRDPNACTPNIASVVAGGSREKEQPPTNDEVCDRASRRLPTHVARFDVCDPDAVSESSREGTKVSTGSRGADRACCPSEKTKEANERCMDSRPSRCRRTLDRVFRHARGEAFHGDGVKAPISVRDGSS
jgi:hypothetical protein